jgi:hypothetical protein
MMRAVKEGKLNWENLNFWDKVSLFNIWEVVGFIGCSCVMFGTSFFIFGRYFSQDDAELFLGVGTFLLWVKTVKYF